MNLKVTGWDNADRIHLAEDTAPWRDVYGDKTLGSTKCAQFFDSLRNLSSPSRSLCFTGCHKTVYVSSINYEPCESVLIHGRLLPDVSRPCKWPHLQGSMVQGRANGSIQSGPPTLKMTPLHCLETLENKHPLTQRNIPEERRSHKHCSDNLMNVK